MNDDNRNKGGGKGRPPRGPGFGGDRKGPPRGGSRPDGRKFGDKSRKFGEKSSDRPRAASDDGVIRGAFRPRRGPDSPDRANRPAGEGQESAAGKRRFSPSKGPRRTSSDRPDFAKSGRPPRERREGDRPSGDRPAGDRPFRARPTGDRPFRERREGDRPFRERREGDRPSGDRPAGDRPFRARPTGDRPFRERRQGDRPSGDRPAGDRPFRARPTGDRPFRERREGDRPRGPRPPRDGSFRDQSKGRGRPQEGRGGRSNRPVSAPKPRPGDRIAKVMARAGLCSRRDAEAWILEGRVVVNGEILLSPARDIIPTDKVEVDGQALPLRERTRLYLYHKPRGLVTTARDPEGRPTVFANLPKGLPRLVSVGRLDINTEGLLLLTNDGGLARLIELPETGWLRRYRVRCFGEINQATLDTLKAGVTIDDMHYGPIEATLDREKGDNVWLTLGLREGKNREVKRVLEHFGLAVNRLIRLSFGPFQLGELQEGAVEEVRTGLLRAQLSPDAIVAAGIDFDGPIFIHDEDPEDIAPPAPVERWDRDRPPRRETGRDRERPLDRATGRDRDQGRDRPSSRGDDRGRPDRRPGAGPRPSRPDRPDRESKPRFGDKGDLPDHPIRPHRNTVQKKIWRADDAETGRSGRSAPKVPRRGQDPKEARAENAERSHKRAGSIKTRSGKSVTVEKLAPRTRSEPGRAAPSSQGKGAPRSKGPRPTRGR